MLEVCIYNFTLPEKLSILANKSILLPPELTGFASSTSKVVLSLGSGKAISEYIAPQKGGEQVQGATSTILNSNVFQVFTKEEFEKKSFRATDTKILVRKKANNIVSRNPPLAQLGAEQTPLSKGGESAQVQIVQNIENPNKIEFKNEETIFSKLKNLWGF